MKVDFPYCLALVLKHEGGYVNDPKDPGGETNMGISKRSFPKEDIRNLTRERAAELYERHYWIPAKCTSVPAPLRPLYFDTAVNCGVATAVRLLQLSCGIEADGIFGPATMKASIRARRADFAEERRQYYLRMVHRNPSLARFLGGWLNRIASYTQ
jgi:lysozyme family protein